MRSLTFLNNGPSATPGLIVMRLQDVDKLDAKYSEILVLINANHQPIQFSDNALAGIEYILHPVQQSSTDAALREAKFEATSSTFSIPAITTAVFVVEQPGLQLSQTVIFALGAIGILVVAGLVYMLAGRSRQKTQPKN